MKANWSHEADGVIAGDSRVYRGVSPAAMASQLPQRRLLNYGFGSVRYSDSYLRSIHNLIDPASEAPTIILGISPLSLCKPGRDQFTEYTQKQRLVNTVNYYLGDLLSIAEPIDIKRTYRACVEGKVYYEEYYPDGWAAGVKVPETNDAVAAYAQVFRNGERVDAATVARLMDAVRSWTQAGIAVYGFRPPTSLEMVILENAHSGFDEGTVAAAFEAAGGIWINIDSSGYRSYDGSHLHRDAAEALSLRIAQRIADIERRSTRSPPPQRASGARPLCPILISDGLPTSPARNPMSSPKSNHHVPVRISS